MIDVSEPTRSRPHAVARRNLIRRQQSDTEKNHQPRYRRGEWRVTLKQSEAVRGCRCVMYDVLRKKTNISLSDQRSDSGIHLCQTAFFGYRAMTQARRLVVLCRNTETNIPNIKHLHIAIRRCAVVDTLPVNQGFRGLRRSNPARGQKPLKSSIAFPDPIKSHTSPQRHL